ncbi:MAG: hypothetical protein K9I85_15365 [Saprospiraceae bacterium]|nr:hypothetical protein [Saprospiraceae bacterium]
MMRLELSTWNVLYLLGLLLAIGGCNSVFLLEGNLIYGGILIYGFGQVLVWLSGTTTFNKMIAFLLPAVIFMSVYSITRDDRVREPAIWLIEEGYTGPLYVFLNEKCGAEKEVEQEKRVYRMDHQGRCFSQFEANSGVVFTPSEFYYTDRTGYRVHLQDLREYGDSTRLKPVWRDSTGQPIFVYSGEGVKGRIGETKVVLEYAFVGTYREYLEFVRSSPLKDSLPNVLGPIVEAFRVKCE